MGPWSFTHPSKRKRVMRALMLLLVPAAMLRPCPVVAQEAHDLIEIPGLQVAPEDFFLQGSGEEFVVGPSGATFEYAIFYRDSFGVMSVRANDKLRILSSAYQPAAECSCVVIDLDGGEFSYGRVEFEQSSIADFLRQNYEPVVQRRGTIAGLRLSFTFGERGTG